MTDICRLCASLKRLDQLVATVEDSTVAIKVKLIRCCQIEIPQNDDFMPQNVCHECVQNLNTSWNFAEKVLQAQETLRQAFIVDFDNDLEQIPEETQQEDVPVRASSGPTYLRRKKRMPNKVLLTVSIFIIQSSFYKSICLCYSPN